MIKRLRAELATDLDAFFWCLVGWVLLLWIVGYGLQDRLLVQTARHSTLPVAFTWCLSVVGKMEE